MHKLAFVWLGLPDKKQFIQLMSFRKAENYIHTNPCHFNSTKKIKNLFPMYFISWTKWFLVTYKRGWGGHVVILLDTGIIVALNRDQLCLMAISSGDSLVVVKKNRCQSLELNALIREENDCSSDLRSYSSILLHWYWWVSTPISV